MPFTGPQGQGPFEDHSDCADAMADEEGVADADALCAVWERDATGKAETKMRFDELSRRRLLQAAVDHPDLVELGVEQKAVGDDDWSAGAETFRVLAAPDDDTDYDADVLGVGIDFPESGVYVDWHRAAFPDELEHPHVSEYGSVEDLQQATGNVIERPDRVEQKAAAPPIDVVGAPTSTTHRAGPQDVTDGVLQEALEADDFIIYGKASIEQYDVEQTRISVAGLEEALDRFFDSEDAPGIISRGHADVPVGMPVREHTLDSDTTLVIDGEEYTFDAGETLRTEVKDADDDQLPELWLVSRLANDSDIARETRAQALAGELNGYSVTVKPKDGATRQTEDGRDVLAVDLHAVTVGTDEQIKNKGSEFDVAEFKALARAADVPGRLAAALRNEVLSMTDGESKDERTLLGRLLMRSGEELMDDEPDGTDGGGAEQKAGDADADEESDMNEETKAAPIDAALEAGTISAADAAELRPIAAKMDDGGVQTVIDAISENDLDVEDAVDLLNAMGGDAGADASASKGDYEDDEDSDTEEKADADPSDSEAEQKGDDGDPDDVEQKADAQEVAESIAAEFGIPADEVLEHLTQLEADMAGEEKDAPGELKSALETAGEVSDRLDDLEAKLDTLQEDALTESDIEQKLEDVDDELLTKAEFEERFEGQEQVGSPTPTDESGGSNGTTMAEVFGQGGDD